MINCTGVSIGGGGGGGLTSLPIANTLFVAKNGNDATALPNRLDLPYLTIDAALADVTTANDCVFVYPGSYTVSYVGSVAATTLNLYFVNGAQVQFDSGMAISNCEVLNIDGCADLIWENIGSSMLPDLTSLKVACQDITFVLHDFDVGFTPDVVINALGTYFVVGSLEFPSGSGVFYSRYSVNAEYIEIASGTLFTNSYYNVTLTSRSNIIKSWLQLSVTGGQLYNFVFNGMLRNESDPSQATVTVAGVGYIDDYRFRGLQFNGGVYGKTNASLIIVIEGNIRISENCVYEIESVGTFTDLPLMFVTAFSDVIVDEGCELRNLSSNGGRGIINVADGSTVSFTADFKGIMSSGAGTVFVVDTNTLDVVGGVVYSNITIPDANTTTTGLAAANTNSAII